MPSIATLKSSGMLVVVCALLSQTPLLLVHFYRLWQNEHYCFFPLVLGAFGYLCYSRWPTEKLPNRPRDRRMAIGSLTIAMASFGMGALLWSPWLSAFSALFTVAFAFILLCGGSAIPRLGTTWMLLWLLLPLPTNLDRELVLRLQGISSQSASQWLDALGFHHVLTGHVIHIPGHRFLVEEACSGSHSFFVLLCLTVIFTVGMRYPAVPGILLISSSIGWAIVSNSLRIASLVAFESRFGIDLSQGMPHTVLGLIVFVIALGLLYSTDRLLFFLFARPVEGVQQAALAEDDELRAARKAKARAQKAIRGATGMESRPLLGAFSFSVIPVLFLVIGTGQIIPFISGAALSGNDVQQVKSSGNQIAASAIEPLPDGWQLLKHEHEHRNSQQGNYSTTWRLAYGDTVAVVSLDFPFLGWHELSVCYTTQGWELAKRRLEDDQISASSVMFELEKPTGEFGYVVASLFDRKGQALKPPAESGWSLTGMWNSVTDRLTRRGVEIDEMKAAYQFQVFITSPSPLTRDEKEQINALFEHSRERIIEQL